MSSQSDIILIMKDNNMNRVIGGFLVIVALFISVFWNNISNQLAQVTSLSISQKPIFSDIVEVNNINTLNNFISKISFTNAIVRDNFIMETREIISSGGGVTLYFYPSMTANTIAIHNTNKYSQKYLSKHIVVRACCGRYEDRILTFSISNTNYSFSPDGSGSSAVTVGVNKNASSGGGSSSGSGSASGASQVFPQK